jgi:hypothetical protein
MHGRDTLRGRQLLWYSWRRRGWLLYRALLAQLIERSAREQLGQGSQIRIHVAFLSALFRRPARIHG